MSRKRRIAVAVAGIVVSVLAVALVPRGLRRLEFFQVRRVDVLGTRYLEGRQVVAAMKLAKDATLFDDTAPLLRRVVAMAGVQKADVSKRWPGTLVVRVTEWVPVALTPGDQGLVMLDRLGRRLPFDPTRSPADLPLAAADPVVARALFRVMEESAPLFGRIAVARRSGDDVLFEADGRRILVRGEVSADDLLNLQAVMADLARNDIDYEELDARYANRVFVRGWKGVRS